MNGLNSVIFQLQGTWSNLQAASNWGFFLLTLGSGSAKREHLLLAPPPPLGVAEWVAEPHPR